MAIFQPPQVNTWYITQTGKLLKLRLVLQDPVEPKRVLVEYIDGIYQIIDIDEWYCLDLNVHFRYEPRKSQQS